MLDEVDSYKQWTSLVLALTDTSGIGHLISFSLFHFDCESPTLKDSGVAMGVWGQMPPLFVKMGLGIYLNSIIK